MKIRVLIVFLLVCCFACKTEKNESADQKKKPDSEMVFDKVKWNTKDGKDYPYRDKMLNDIVCNDTVRTLKKDEVLELLGEPSYYRDNKNYLYYIIAQKRIGPWPLHTKALVVKLSDDNAIDWIKIYK